MHTRMRLGELLLASGLLSADQLEAALPPAFRIDSILKKYNKKKSKPESF